MLNQKALTINLRCLKGFTIIHIIFCFARTGWNSGCKATKDKKISPKNLRFAAYRLIKGGIFIYFILCTVNRSLFFLFHQKSIKKKLRLALPSCLVGYVRLLYPEPDDNYTGFRKSPVFKKKRK